MDKLIEFIKLTIRHELSGQLTRFAVVGTCAFIIDASLLLLVTNLSDVGPYWGRAISVPPAMFFGFMMNRRFTFRYDGNQRKRVQLPKYVVVQGIGGAINYSVYAALVALVPLVTKYLVLGVAAGAVSAMLWNFGMARVVVFSDENFLAKRDN